jgi:hypothetical protein
MPYTEIHESVQTSKLKRMKNNKNEMTMSKFALVFALLIACLPGAYAQQPTFAKGDIELSAGIGLLPTFVKDDGNTLVPPVTLRAGYRFSSNFSLSAFAAYSATETAELARTTGVVEQFQNDFLIFGLRPTVHATSFKNWDIYGGFAIGYVVPTVERTVISEPVDTRNVVVDEVQYETSFTRDATNELLFSGFIGANYYFRKKTAVFAEVGYGISILNAGVTFKL